MPDPIWKSWTRRAAGRARVGTLLSMTTTMRLYGGSDKYVHGYHEPYVRHLAGRRLHRLRVLEIGVGGYASSTPGGSLRVWRDVFPRSRVVGLDLHHKDVHLGRRVAFVRGDQSVTADLDRAVEALGGPPDVVIDDGSHLAEHARASFVHLFPMLPSGGMYVVEDLHTSYWPDWGGSVPAGDDTAIGLARELIDSVQSLDSTFRRRPHLGAAPPDTHVGVGALHVYPGIFFVERR